MRETYHGHLGAFSAFGWIAGTVGWRNRPSYRGMGNFLALGIGNVALESRLILNANHFRTRVTRCHQYTLTIWSRPPLL